MELTEDIRHFMWHTWHETGSFDLVFEMVKSSYTGSSEIMIRECELDICAGGIRYPESNRNRKLLCWQILSLNHGFFYNRQKE